MTQKQIFLRKWLCYGLLGFVTLFVQAAVLEAAPPWGLQLAILPAAVTCVAMYEGPERGGLYGLIAGILWFWTGAPVGMIVMTTVVGLLAGGLCAFVLVRSLPTAAMLCLMALCLTMLASYLLRFYLGAIGGWAFLRLLLPAMGLSMLACPFCFWIARATARRGGIADGT